jgi:hypothetical protein
VVKFYVCNSTICIVNFFYACSVYKDARDRVVERNQSKRASSEAEGSILFKRMIAQEFRKTNRLHGLFYLQPEWNERSGGHFNTGSPESLSEEDFFDPNRIRACEKEYVQYLSNHLVKILLVEKDDVNCRVVRHLVTELFANSVLFPVYGLFTPHTVSLWISYGLSPAVCPPAADTKPSALAQDIAKLPPLDDYPDATERSAALNFSPPKGFLADPCWMHFKPDMDERAAAKLLLGKAAGTYVIISLNGKDLFSLLCAYSSSPCASDAAKPDPSVEGAGHANDPAAAPAVSDGSPDEPPSSPNAAAAARPATAGVDSQSSSSVAAPQKEYGLYHVPFVGYTTEPTGFQICLLSSDEYFPISKSPPRAVEVLNGSLFVTLQQMVLALSAVASNGYDFSGRNGSGADSDEPRPQQVPPGSSDAVDTERSADDREASADGATNKARSTGSSAPEMNGSRENSADAASVAGGAVAGEILRSADSAELKVKIDGGGEGEVNDDEEEEEEEEADDKQIQKAVRRSSNGSLDACEEDAGAAAARGGGGGGSGPSAEDKELFMEQERLVLLYELQGAVDEFQDALRFCESTLQSQQHSDRSKESRSFGKMFSKKTGEHKPINIQSDATAQRSLKRFILCLEDIIYHGFSMPAVDSAAGFEDDESHAVAAQSIDAADEERFPLHGSTPKKEFSFKGMLKRAISSRKDVPESPARHNSTDERSISVSVAERRPSVGTVNDDIVRLLESRFASQWFWLESFRVPSDHEAFGKSSSIVSSATTRLRRNSRSKRDEASINRIHNAWMDLYSNKLLLSLEDCRMASSALDETETAMAVTAVDRNCLRVFLYDCLSQGCLLEKIRRLVELAVSELRLEKKGEDFMFSMFYDPVRYPRGFWAHSALLLTRSDSVRLLELLAPFAELAVVLPQRATDGSAEGDAADEDSSILSFIPTIATTLRAVNHSVSLSNVFKDKDAAAAKPELPSRGNDANDPAALPVSVGSIDNQSPIEKSNASNYAVARKLRQRRASIDDAWRHQRALEESLLTQSKPPSILRRPMSMQFMSRRPFDAHSASGRSKSSAETAVSEGPSSPVTSAAELETRLRNMSYVEAESVEVNSAPSGQLDDPSASRKPFTADRPAASQIPVVPTHEKDSDSAAGPGHSRKAVHSTPFRLPFLSHSEVETGGSVDEALRRREVSFKLAMSLKGRPSLSELMEVKIWQPKAKLYTVDFTRAEQEDDRNGLVIAGSSMQQVVVYQLLVTCCDRYPEPIEVPSSIPGEPPSYRYDSHPDKWLLRKRYSDFDELHKILKAQVGSKISNSLPLPQKQFINVAGMGSGSAAFIEKRKQRLQEYVDCILRVVSSSVEVSNMFCLLMCAIRWG